MIGHCLSQLDHPDHKCQPSQRELMVGIKGWDKSDILNSLMFMWCIWMEPSRCWMMCGAAWSTRSRHRPTWLTQSAQLGLWLTWPGLAQCHQWPTPNNNPLSYSHTLWITLSHQFWYLLIPCQQGIASWVFPISGIQPVSHFTGIGCPFLPPAHLTHTTTRPSNF